MMDAFRDIARKTIVSLITRGKLRRARLGPQRTVLQVSVLKGEVKEGVELLLPPGKPEELDATAQLRTDPVTVRTPSAGRWPQSPDCGNISYNDPPTRSDQWLPVALREPKLCGVNLLSDEEAGNHGALLRQQTILAKFGELALKSDDLDEILTEACRLVGEALGTDLAKIVALQEDGHTLLVRAGVG